MESDRVVRRLKEILHDRSEQEIYDVLKECGMDPGAAVERLLSQGRIVASPLPALLRFSFSRCLWSGTQVN